MDDALLKPCTAFDGFRLLCSGPLVEVALAVKNAVDRQAGGPLLLFSDVTGRVFDIDTRGTKEEVLARLAAHDTTPTQGEGGLSASKRPRGRPRLGVVGREVTLLPRHWEWLSAQPGGASVTIRKLVAKASRSEDGCRRAARDAAYHFTHAIAGDLPGFEEATRALYSGDRSRFEAAIASWPPDVREHALRLAFAETEATSPAAPPRAAYLEPTEAAGRALVQRGIAGEVVMLNLLRLRDTADYSATPQLAPPEPISGAEAFRRYVDHTLPLLRASGGDLAFLGEGGSLLIGPPDERWDLAMLVRQSSVEAFIAFASDAAYLEGLGHRTAALEDSRLLPLVQVPWT